MLKEVEEKGVIFLDTDSALQQVPELVKEYFATVVPYTDNKSLRSTAPCGRAVRSSMSRKG